MHLRLPLHAACRYCPANEDVIRMILEANPCGLRSRTKVSRDTTYNTNFYVFVTVLLFLNGLNKMKPLFHPSLTTIDGKSGTQKAEQSIE